MSRSEKRTIDSTSEFEMSSYPLEKRANPFPFFLPDWYCSDLSRYGIYTPIQRLRLLEDPQQIDPIHQILLINLKKGVITNRHFNRYLWLRRNYPDLMIPFKLSEFDWLGSEIGIRFYLRLDRPKRISIYRPSKTRIPCYLPTVSVAVIDNHPFVYEDVSQCLPPSQKSSIPIGRLFSDLRIQRLFFKTFSANVTSTPYKKCHSLYLIRKMIEEKILVPYCTSTYLRLKSILGRVRQEVTMSFPSSDLLSMPSDGTDEVNVRVKTERKPSPKKGTDRPNPALPLFEVPDGFDFHIEGEEPVCVTSPDQIHALPEISMEW